MSKKIIEFNQGKATLEVDSYAYDLRLCINVEMVDDYESFGSITIDLHDCYLRDSAEGFIDNSVSSNEFDLIPKLKELGIIKESYGRINYNYGSYEYVKFDLEKLKEYDKDGVEKFIFISKEIGRDINI